MSWRVWVLAAAVAGLAIYLFVFDAPELREREEAIEADKILMPAVIAEVDTLAIERNNLPFRIVRRSDGWWIEEPIEVKANDAVVMETIELLSTLERWRWIDDDVSASDLELFALAPDSPGRRRIVLGGKSRRWALDVGHSLNGRELRYVRRVGRSDLEVGDPAIDTIVEGRHHGYRITDLFSVVDSALVRIEFDGDNGKWSASRDERGRWWSELGGTKQRLRRGDLDDIALSVSESRARGFLRDGMTEADWMSYGLDQPWGRVAFEDNEGGSDWVALGNELDVNVYYGRRGDESSLFTISPGFLVSLQVDPRNLVDRNPIEDNVRRAERLRVELPDGRSATLSRAGTAIDVFNDSDEVPHSDPIDIAAYNTFRLLEDFQPESSMLLLQGSDSTPFERVFAEGEIDWADNHVEFSVGFWGGRNEPWLLVDGQEEMHQIPREFALQLRTLVELAHEPAQ